MLAFAPVFDMMTPEVIVSLAGFALTFGMVLYKFGRLEGKIVARLDEHERRLNMIDRRASV